MTLDDHTIPRPAPSAAGVVVDGERVLLDTATGSLHLLNDVGAEIWSRLDGSRTVGALVTELSEAFGTEPERVEPDVHQFLSSLNSLGLLEGSTATPGVDLARSRDAGSLSLDSVWVDWYTAQVVDALRARGLEAMLLKGPAIRRWLYRDSPGERGYLDADLLVPRGELCAVAGVLSDLGFELDDAAAREPLSPWADSWRRPADGAAVDLHHTLQGCEYSSVDPWPTLSATAMEEEVGGTSVLVPSIPARAVQIVLVSPADRPWRKWDDLGRVLDQLSLEEWRAAAAVARALGVERKFGYRLCQSPVGAALARQIGVPSPPTWWLRWDADPMLAWAALLAELPGWRARLRLARQLVRPPAGYSPGSWALHIMRLVPGAASTLLRSAAGARADRRARADREA